MKKKIHQLLVFSFLVLLSSCSKDAYDDYYGRPDSLEPPIYQQLEARGNFKNLLVLIEKAGYKDILGKAGYWTMLAPNDEAFAKYFQEQGITDVNKIDAETAGKIVRYALIYNAFREEKMSDYQSGTGWVIDNAFRRRTAYYDGFISKTINGQPKIFVNANRNGGFYAIGDNNNKYITYFTDEYFTAKGLSSADFKYFYPNAEYTGFNVFDSKVTEADIVAENGIIHEVNKINLPLVTLDQYLEQKPQYSKFRELLENYGLTRYVFSQDATNAYRNFTGKSENVEIKLYDPLLSFSPNNENYLKQADNDGQSDLYTMLVPENPALENFINTILLKNYPSLNVLPQYIFRDFINAHMVQNAVWPSKGQAYNNALNENLRFNFNSDIKEAKILSNGFFYGTSKVQKSNLFYSVYTSAYLDPKFTMATRLMNDGSGLKEMISNINTRYTLFLPSDAKLMEMGFGYNSTLSLWTYINPAVGGSSVASSVARARLLRILYNGIVLTPNGELNDLSGSGIIRSGDMDLPGEYIKWNNNKLYAAGNELSGIPVNIIGHEDQQNGRTYYVDNLLQFSEEMQGLKIKRLSETPNSEYLSFFNYLKNSSLYDPVTGKIQGVELGTSYTFIIPNNAAVAKAVDEEVLPKLIAPTAQNQKDMVVDFIRAHILVNKIASDDGFTTGEFETLRKDSFDEKIYVLVQSTPGTLSFRDSFLNWAHYIPSQSKHLADRSLIHLVDNYLTYTQQ
ncbi:fasciclin domain-containing protein [Flavobacterium pectinovorum]|uniref:fasciclin domain-containing protein n=1 Tax=Flavobacterium pectinovorum TaxID=29533 RepID=UPI001FAD8232|nr:fasciclin domain-containing protein [Flavobacterium pectinovorum]MCI9843363.1 fasciclin domain-containing protein [Flavobacterium pectinovorum]